MSEQKMGTHYVREMAASFKEIAEKTSVDELKAKLTAMANEMEPLATKLYFKTQKGNEDMKKAAEDLEGFKDKLVASKDMAEADSIVGPLVDLLEKTIKHVKTMKVRMT